MTLAANILIQEIHWNVIDEDCWATELVLKLKETVDVLLLHLLYTEQSKVKFTKLKKIKS